jgi:hypothetical protein
MGHPAHPVDSAGIRVEIILSARKLNAGRALDDRFDLQDYAYRLAEHLAPVLGDVVVDISDMTSDHAMDILVPPKMERHADMVNMLACRIVESIQQFDERAPDCVARRKPANIPSPSWTLGPFQVGR